METQRKFSYVPFPQVRIPTKNRGIKNNMEKFDQHGTVRN